MGLGWNNDKFTHKLQPENQLFARRAVVLEYGGTFGYLHLTNMFVTFMQFLFLKAARAGNLR